MKLIKHTVAESLADNAEGIQDVEDESLFLSHKGRIMTIGQVLLDSEGTDRLRPSLYECRFASFFLNIIQMRQREKSPLKSTRMLYVVTVLFLSSTLVVASAKNRVKIRKNIIFFCNVLRAILIICHDA